MAFPDESDRVQGRGYRRRRGLTRRFTVSTRSVVDLLVKDVAGTAASSLSGRAYPLGATLEPGGVNFSIFSRTASAIDLLLFEADDDPRPSRVITIDPAANRTYHYWHVFVPGIRAGQIYGYRMRGPFDPSAGLRFDYSKLLLDPYGRAVAVPPLYDREAARAAGDNTATAMKSVVADPSLYDWRGDTRLKRPSSRTIIYELHVRGFTRHPSSGLGEEIRGTYAGLDRENSVPAGSRHHRCRAASGLPVRSSGLPGRPRKLLGLCSRLVLRAAPRL